MTSWKEQLGDRIPDQLGGEVDLFEGQIALKKQGKIDDKIFAETPASPGCVRTALRQRPSRRWHRSEDVDVPLR